jgi:hypothetical protein
VPLQGTVHDIQKWHRKKTGWKVEQLYMHTHIYMCVYHIWRKTFISKTWPWSSIFIWMSNLEWPSTVIPGEQATRSYIFRDLRSQFTLIEVFVQSNSTHGSIQTRFQIEPTIRSATTFDRYKDKLARYDMAQWLLLVVIYKVVQKIVRISLAAVP